MSSIAADRSQARYAIEFVKMELLAEDVHEPLVENDESFEDGGGGGGHDDDN